MAIVGSRLPQCTDAGAESLRADAAMTTLLGGTSKVYTNVPEDTAPPYVLVMGGQEEPFAGDFGEDDGGRQSEVKAVSVSAHRGTKEVDDLNNRILEVWLTDATWSPVPGFSAVLYRRSDEPEVVEWNGQLWYQRTGRVMVFTVS